MAEAQGLDNQIGKEPVEKSLKPFSDADIIGELSRRLHANPQLDPIVLKTFDAVTAEIKKKLTPEEPKADVKPPEVQAPSESEGKKWAKIIREKGAGYLQAKFRRSWTFTNFKGEEEATSEPGAPKDYKEGENWHYSVGGQFGDSGLCYASDKVGEAEREYLRNFSRGDLAEERKYGRVFNSLIVGDTARKFLDKENKGRYIRFMYVSKLTNAPDSRTGLLNLNFVFALPFDKASELLAQIKQNPDLIEELFQNIYSGLTQEGKAKRVAVKELQIVEVGLSDIVFKLSKLPFSKPIGEET